MTPPLAMMPAAMERPTFNSLLQGLPVLGRTGDGSVRISSLVTDSRRIIPGSLFFALPGLRANGHVFLDDAIARGAAAIISGEPVAGLPAVAAAQVVDPRRALAEVARRFFGHPEAALQLGYLRQDNDFDAPSPLVAVRWFPVGSGGDGSLSPRAPFDPLL